MKKHHTPQMNTLSIDTLLERLEGMFSYTLHGNTSIGDSRLQGISLDSREVSKESIFIALVGEKVDGHDYIDDAIEKGAIAVVCQKMPQNSDDSVLYIHVPEDTQHYAGHIASAYYNFPSRNMKVIGITGTNGKTTIATSLWYGLTLLGKRVGLISTSENRIGGEVEVAQRTTPDPVSLQKLFARMRSAECAYVVMEVSSHAVTMGRIVGTIFGVGIFTNLTRDHINFHGTMEDYADAKKGFFDGLPSNAIAITNSDSDYGMYMVNDTKATVRSYSIEQFSDYHAQETWYSLNGSEFILFDTKYTTQLVGEFNIYNMLAVIAGLEACSIDRKRTHTILPEIPSVRGRFELVTRDSENKSAIIDYAHTPDALENVLESMNHLQEDGQKIITIFGCAGDRDHSKRDPMMNIAMEKSDYVIVTSDNPRSEDPEGILDDVTKAFINDTENTHWERITDRKEAIKKGYEIMTSKDILLIAGKGHEDYQEVHGKKIHFDDREVFLEI